MEGRLPVDVMTTGLPLLLCLLLLCVFCAGSWWAEANHLARCNSPEQTWLRSLYRDALADWHWLAESHFSFAFVFGGRTFTFTHIHSSTCTPTAHILIYWLIYCACHECILYPLITLCLIQVYGGLPLVMHTVEPGCNSACVPVCLRVGEREC